MKNKKNILPLVSVVMPSLNQVQFLEVAVRSVLEQDYQNIELIVADGMSTDDSLVLLVQLQKEYGERLLWSSEKDGGAAVALNHAIAQAKGDVVGWLNSDDMYTQAAVTRVMDYFSKHPNHQMVYGQGRHINVAGEILSIYPTRPPSTAIDRFADGSFICQPTVFMRREALAKVGKLDTSICTAFDFDLFIRFFKRYPYQIGILRHVQAFSRLHSACMTQRLRRQVALDGMYVVAKEIGTVPEHWFWTHINEICESYPLGADTLPLVNQIESFLKDAEAYFKPDVLRAMVDRLKGDWRIRLATPELFVTVQSDGWVGKQLTVKYRWEGKPAAAVLVSCNAPWPVAGKLRLKVFMPSGNTQRIALNVPDDFTLRLEVPECEKSGCMIWTIEASQSFVPAKHDKRSTDKRKLSYRVLKISTET